MVDGLNKNLNMDKIVEKYMRLSRQSDWLRQRLALSIPTSTPLSPPLEDDSPSASPARQPSSTQLAYAFGSAPTWPTTSSPVSSIPEAHHATTPGEDTLHEINQQIKAILTELLNCDSVKHDKSFRAWVQGRLMDAEMELKRYRRRRSSFDKKTIEAFSDHLGHAPVFAYRATY